MTATEVFTEVFDEKIDVTREFEAKSKLISAMLPHVAFDGWSFKALDQASESLGLPKIIGRELFRNAEVNMIAHRSRMADKAMLEALEAENLESMRVQDRIKRGIELRFRNHVADREAIRRGASLLALPQNAKLASKLVWETCDAIWLAAGDTATDYNHYTKRGLLAGVYTSTFSVWLRDETENLSDTMAFLDRRISNVLKVFGTIGKVAKPLEGLRDKFSDVWKQSAT